ncbi:molybdopterin-dependent oxidoreductase, partial [Clostridium saudiense]|nr:molybdopterin-dependent oxidoreductase [Clostridium saudiense]
CNPVVAHPILWGKTKNNKDCIKISIDPRRTETVSNCDIWIDIKPKSDLVLLYTLANVLIEKDWIDKEYIEKYTEDFEGFKEHVKKYTLEDVEEKTASIKSEVTKDGQLYKRCSAYIVDNDKKCISCDITLIRPRNNSKLKDGYIATEDKRQLLAKVGYKEVEEFINITGDKNTL